MFENQPVPAPPVYKKGFLAFKMVDLSVQLVNTIILILIWIANFISEETGNKIQLEWAQGIYDFRVIYLFIYGMAVWQPICSIVTISAAPKKYPFRIPHIVILVTIGVSLITVPLCIGMFLLLFGAFFWYLAYFILAIVETIYVFIKIRKAKKEAANALDPFGNFS